MTTTKSRLSRRLNVSGLIGLVLLLTGLGLTGCATTSKTQVAQHPPAEEIYSEGRKALQAQDYPLASSHFKK